jgi:hypothetical protein
VCPVNIWKHEISATVSIFPICPIRADMVPELFSYCCNNVA